MHLYLLLLENVLADLAINIFCFLKEKIIYPLKDIRLLCIVFPHLVSLIPPSEHLSACNQHTMTLTNNNWTTTPHHNVVLIPHITPAMWSSFTVQRLESLRTYICFLFPLVHLLWSVTPAEHNETQTRVFCCNSEPQFKFWCLALISQKLTDARSTQRRAESCASCSAVFVMLIIFYWRGGLQTNSVAHLLVTLYATLPATREIYETHMGKGRRNVRWLIYITDC